MNRRSFTDEQYRIAARSKADYAAKTDGDFDLPDDATVSQGDEGAYVGCWVWVGYDEIDAYYEDDDDGQS